MCVCVGALVGVDVEVGGDVVGAEVGSDVVVVSVVVGMIAE